MPSALNRRSSAETDVVMASSAVSAITCTTLLLILLSNCYPVDSIDPEDLELLFVYGVCEGLICELNTPLTETVGELFRLTKEYEQNRKTGWYLTPEQLLLLEPEIPKEELTDMLKRGGLRMDKPLNKENSQLFVTLVTEIAFFVSRFNELKKVITIQELMQYSFRESSMLTIEDLRSMFNRSDSNKKDGKLDFLEFHVMNTIALPELLAFKELAELNNGTVNPDHLRPKNVVEKALISAQKVVGDVLGSAFSFLKVNLLGDKPPDVSQPSSIHPPEEATQPLPNRPIERHALIGLRRQQFEWLLNTVSCPFCKGLTLNHYKDLRRNYGMLLIYNKIDTNGNNNVSKLELLSATRSYRPTQEFSEFLDSCYTMLQEFGSGAEDISLLEITLLRLKVMEIYQQNDPDDDGLDTTEMVQAVNGLLGDHIPYADFGEMLMESSRTSDTNFSYEDLLAAVAELYRDMFVEQYRFLGMYAMFQ